MRGGRSFRAVVLAGALVFLLTACGGGKSAASSANKLPGAKIFASAGCSGCHTLATAQATGTAGPNLDQVRPDAQKVSRQVRNGGVGMPSFSNKLSATQIQQVADFVSRATQSATGGGSGAAGLS